MKIAIIGTGNVGSALGSSFVKAGHEVTFAAQDAAKTQAVAAAAGGTAGTSLVDAVAASEVVVLAVPYGVVQSVVSEIAPVAAGKIVIDATNPLKADYSGLATGPDASGAELIAQALPDAKVVKAFNTLFAGIQANPDVLGTQLDALFATDDDAAKDAVCSLSSSIGFRPVHVGPLAAARELEAMAWLNIRLQVLTGGAWNTAYALVAPPAASLTAA